MKKDHPLSILIGCKSRFSNYLKNLLNLTKNLFGRKSKKSFLSVISYLLNDYEEEKIFSSEEKRMIKNIIHFGDKKVSNIMTPFSDIVAIKQDSSLEQVKTVITNDGHTRIPVFRESFDDIVGFIHSKDMVKFLCNGNNNDFAIGKIMRKILFIPGSMRLVDVMLRMRVARVHIAVVLDEFGGVDGLVTIENIVEEIVGNIEDEHDLPEDNSVFRVKKVKDNLFQFGGRVDIKKFEELVDRRVKSEDDDFQTVSGFVTSRFTNVPMIGEEIVMDNLRIKIIDSDSRVIKMIETEILSSE